MTQEERWQVRYNEVKDFIETNRRNPSKYCDEEKIDGSFPEEREEADECRGVARAEAR